MFDISLLYELKKGNREAFNGVFRYYYPRIMAYTASMVEQKAAEDIVQDVFLYVWENREKLYVSDGFHSYLFQSAYTRCLDYFKKNILNNILRCFLLNHRSSISHYLGIIVTENTILILTRSIWKIIKIY